VMLFIMAYRVIREVKGTESFHSKALFFCLFTSD